MATAEESKDEDDELRNIDREISELRSAKKEVFETTRKGNAQIAQLKRKRIEIRHRLRSEQHDRERRQQIFQRVFAELKQAKSEVVKLSDMNRRLKQSADQTVLRIVEGCFPNTTKLENVANVPGQSRSETGDSVAVFKLQIQLAHTTKLLSKTKEELNATRQRLSDVQERLTVAEQVTAATQQRALQESHNSEQLELAQHQPTTPTGFSLQT